MKLAPDRLATQLGQTLGALYVVHGDEPLLVSEAGDAIRAAARQQGFDEREILVSGPGFGWEALFASTGTMSLFGSRKVVDLRIPNGKPGKDGGDALKQLAEHTPDRAEDVLTLITLPELDWATRKTAWFGALDRRGVVVECNAPPREQLPGWIALRLGAQQQSAPAEALAFIADHVEGNLLAAHQELRKLALLYPAGELSLEQIREAVLDVARYSVEHLRMALLEGNAARCSRLLEGLAGEGTAPPLVLWTLANEVRTLARIQSAQQRGQPVAAAMKAERVFDDRRRNALQRALGRLRPGAVRAALAHAARIDRIIKGIAPGDVWDECLRLCLRLCPPGTARPAPGR
ncbi:DNA polymerase III subunit delta [Nitrogeniibacter mangrovi]|uniref:DNA polymerase III subunit delta n=1 Tax=Nitrogeniibacter mangrovi TaxID=2016596 RepID=A0A6C1B892_9RHOO|nr:DNA polymerase III subunit delta [Nitrogeniibacter mangrovi]QID18938.1 DNA polymerase III subunit delta [Nitrogeniibacter mangrovi]